MPSSINLGERLLFSIAALGLLFSLIVAFILGGLLDSGTNFNLLNAGIITSKMNLNYPRCGEEHIEFQGFMTPIVLTKLDSYKTGELENASSTAALFQWSSLARPLIHESISNVRQFLPPTWPTAGQVGDIWYIVPPGNEDSSNHEFLSKSHYPPQVPESQSFLQRLLSVFHPRPFLQTRSLPRGSIALLRAFNDDWIHILFRVHAEFQLNEPPLRPFWITPSYFMGELVISRNACHVHTFQMRVPNDRKLNADLEWFKQDDDQMTVEIGYFPRMEVKLVCPPNVSVCNNAHVIKWNAEISLDDGYDTIKRKMFPFQQVTYHSLDDAFVKAKLERKLVHSVVLWGALDDQSC